MKRFLVLLAIVGLVLALPLSHVAFAKKKDKVSICHIIEANDVIPFGPVDLYFGIELSVAPSAVPAHVAHGDGIVGDVGVFAGDVAAGPIAAFQDAGANLPAADCYIVVFEPDEVVLP